MLKTRFCPSPTGSMHLGNLRTALFNALLARAKQGIFLLRIEDTDATRSTEVYEHALREDLKWMGLTWQEGPEVGGEQDPYYQSQRHTIYEKYYQGLLSKGMAYPCFCNEEALALNRKVQRASGEPPRYPGTCRKLSAHDIEERQKKGLKATLRFKVPNDQTLVFNDCVRGEQTFLSHDIGDFIIRRTDGTASFMFCNALDDALMGVTHALRGEDHLTNTPRQLMIVEALGLTPPTYGHISLIVGKDRIPLSKRNGSLSVKELRESGYLPLAIINYLARLGHYYPSDDVFSLSELASAFQWDHLGKSPSQFDLEQLHRWQKRVIEKMDRVELQHWLTPTIENIVAKEKQLAFIDVVKPNLLFPEDAHFWGKRLFTSILDYTPKNKQVLEEAGIDFLGSALTFVDEVGVDFNALTAQLKEKYNVNGRSLYLPLRVAITGEEKGPEMKGILPLIGVDVLKKRLEGAIYTV